MRSNGGNAAAIACPTCRAPDLLQRTTGELGSELQRTTRTEAQLPISSTDDENWVAYSPDEPGGRSEVPAAPDASQHGSQRAAAVSSDEAPDTSGAPDPRRSFEAEMGQFGLTHWMGDEEIDFMVYIANLVAIDTDLPFRWVPPGSAVSAFWSTELRGQTSLETPNARRGQFMQETYTETAIEAAIVNIRRTHWTGLFVLTAAGDPTFKASMVGATDSLQNHRSNGYAQVSYEQRAVASRMARYSVVDTEPHPGYDVPLVLLEHTQQDDGDSCGAIQIALLFLVASGICSPFAKAEDVIGGQTTGLPFSRVKITTGAPLYQWMVEAIKALRSFRYSSVPAAHTDSTFAQIGR